MQPAMHINVATQNSVQLGIFHSETRPQNVCISTSYTEKHVLSIPQQRANQHTLQVKLAPTLNLYNTFL